MPSTTLADYQVISDSSFTLTATDPSNQRKTLKFSAPDDLYFVAGPRKPIIGFKIAVTQDTRLEVYLNAITSTFRIVNASLDTSSLFTYWEAFNFLPALNAFTNPVDVIFDCSRGSCGISDVVILYQIDRNG